MAYIEPQVAVELTALGNNPNIGAGNGGTGLSFKTRNFLRQAKEIVGPYNVDKFPSLTSGQQTAIINKATVLATS